MHGARPFVVALHAGAFAAQHRAGQRIAAAAIAAGEAVAGGQHHRGAAPARLGALGVGDALDGARRILGFGRQRQQRLGRRPAACRRDRGRASSWPTAPPARCRRTGPRARRAPCRPRARPACERLRREIGRGDEGRALADEDAQAEIAALAALELLALAHPLCDRDRLAVDVEPSADSAPAAFAHFIRSASRLASAAETVCGRLGGGGFFGLAMPPFYALAGPPSSTAPGAAHLA